MASSHCGELAAAKNLIGYLCSAYPTWTHDRPDTEWRGPIFDPEQLKTEAARKELTEIYYKTKHDAIRREDFFRTNNGDWYAETLSALFDNPGCIGFHLCGTCQRHKARRRGLPDEMEMPDTALENPSILGTDRLQTGLIPGR